VNGAIVLVEREEDCSACKHFEDVNELTKVLRGPRDGFCYRNCVTVMKRFGRICHEFEAAPPKAYWRRLI